MKKVWQLAGSNQAPVEDIAALKTALLRQRHLEPTEQSFFALDYAQAIADPQALYGMSAATRRIRQAIKHGQRILIYGDYDADGVCATAIVVSALRQLGGQAIPYLPHRLDDGYGLSLPALKNLAPEFDLCITVDCGVSNATEVAWLVSQGKDVIIADHHELPNELPAALAILHPRHPAGNYPWGYLCGAGVAWKLATALIGEDKAKWLLDLAALGTLADVVPLLGENRAIVRFGLEILRRTRRPGLRALLSAVRLDPANLTADSITWRVIPYINAAGRMDHPQPALDLLLATNAKQATALAAQLQQYNQARQTVTTRVLREAQQHINQEQSFIFVHNITWPAGVVGLAAGRLAKTFARPAIVIGHNGRHAVGSARAPTGHNVLHLLEQGRGHMLKLGGHAQAAGFSVAVDKVAHLQEALREHMNGKELISLDQPVQSAEAILEASLLHRHTVDLLEQFEPFGEGNPKPAFIAQGLRLLDKRAVGKKQEHLKCSFLINDDAVDGIGFGLAATAGQLQSAVDVLFHLELNEYQGRTRLQLAIQDMAPAGQVQIINS